VDQIVLSRADGTESAYGQSNGRAMPEFILESDEFLTEIKGRSGEFLYGIQFITNKGRSSVFFGNPFAGETFHMKADPANHIWALRR